MESPLRSKLRGINPERLKDASDIPHAISAYIARCEAIVAYDHHFESIADVIPYKTPEDYP